MTKLPPIIQYGIDEGRRTRWRPMAPVSMFWRLFCLMMWAFSPVIAWFSFLLFWFGAWPWVRDHWQELTRW